MFDFHIFADDTNLFYSNSSLVELESIVNYNLRMVSDWLMANKVSLNISKTNFIIFHPPQKVKSHTVKLTISNREIMQENLLSTWVSWLILISVGSITFYIFLKRLSVVLAYSLR